MARDGCNGQISDCENLGSMLNLEVPSRLLALEDVMKVIKSALLALALTVPLTAAGAAAHAAADNTVAVRISADWVCYYDRDTRELKYCQWE